MKKWLLIALLMVGCGTSTNVPDRAASDELGDRVTLAQSNVNDRAAGNNAAIVYTAGKLPASREKEVILLFGTDQFRLLGQPRVETQTEFEKVASQLLSTDASERAKGEAARIKLSNENQALRDKMEKLTAEFKAEREKEKAEHAAQLVKVRQEAVERERRMIAWIFFAGGGLLVASGVAMMVFAAQIPMFGPKAAFSTMAAGGAAILTGIVTLQLMKQLDEHPWIIWAGSGIIVLILTGVGALLYANHVHDKDK